MAFEQADPFSWARSYMNAMSNASAQDNSHAQNALMQVFQTEAGRQQPWAELPVAMAKQNNASRLSFGNQVAMHDYKQSNKPAPPLNKITGMIYQTAKGMGVDPILALAIADIETGGKFDPQAQNPTSSAYGLFQQLNSNWAQYGKGLDRSNPEHQTRAGITYMRDVINAIERSGQKVTPGLVYFGYQQGPGAVSKALRNLDAPVHQVLGVEQARLNGARQGQTMRSFMQKWISEGNRRYEKHKAVRTRPNETPSREARLNTVFGEDLVQTTIDDDENDNDDSDVVWDVTD